MRSQLIRELSLLIGARTIWLGVSFFAVITLVIPSIFIGQAALSAESLSVFIWSGLLLSSLLSLDHYFSYDHSDGTLDLLRTSEMTDTEIIIIKSLAHWLAVMLPLIPVAGLVVKLSGGSWHQTGLVTLSILIASPAITMVSCLVAALTLAARFRHSISSILLLPLCLPSVLFAAAISLGGDETIVEAILLCATYSIVCIVTVPIAATGLLRELSS